MRTLTRLENYQDDAGNTVRYEKTLDRGVKVLFRGQHNTLVVKPDALLPGLTIMFDCDHGYCEIGNNAFKGTIRVGHYSKVAIGDHVTCTSDCYISTAEYATVAIGNDCMLASGIEIRADDAHPIFDVDSGERINLPRPIHIGDHVWLGARSVVLGGAQIGDGSVIGLGSVVKGTIPNNCVAAGIPAKVIRRNCAWERPHLTLSKPYYKPNVHAVDKSP
ncbi:DapH/DapD/GlmU-related protein [Cupriavidus sp. 2TAF22]|uniref:acyltransferase n=1 Tax=unclassified Cupriavidus TaxID=2640874 RepID=UPI003F8DC81C